MQSPLLSVIMPVLRCEFLREAVESAQRSGIEPEIILVDDGSTDETADIARTLGRSIIYIRQENAGPAAARNRGLEIARGRFIAFLDADDVWAETHPANALRYLQQHPDVDLVLGRVQLLTQDRVSGKFEPTGKSFSTYQLGAAVAHRELFEKIGGFNSKMRYGEDVDWFLRVRESSAATSILNEAALYYRLHSSNQPHVYERSRTGLLDAFHKSLIRRRESTPVAMHDSSMRPLISVVLPVFNCESYVAAAIASVVAQDYRPLEVIVVDDGSTDRTREIVREIPEATLLEQPHRGAGAARNEGVRAAKGELIAFIDADDLWIQNKLTAQVNALNADPSLEAVFAHLTEFRGNDRAQSEAIAAPMLGTMLIKRASFERVGGFDDEENALEGFDWYLRASEKSLRSRILPDVLYQRRIHSANRSVAHRDLNGYLRAIKSSLDRRRAAGNSPLKC
jgi:glycosyltransferase involved in cell wall biosynthesis